MKTLVIAEKPELGRAVANAMIPDGKEINGTICYNDFCVTWCYGHLLNLADPSDYDSKYLDRNDISILPIGFRDWKLVPPKDVIDPKTNRIVVNNEYKRKRLFMIGKMLKEYPVVIHCGDPDSEGELLINEILDFFNYKGCVKRVLINDNLPSNIKKAFSNLEDDSTYKNLGNAASARRMADACFGYSHSRLATIRNGVFLTVGRVQTPTLNLVVKRDFEIENHVARYFYELFLPVELNNLIIKFSLIPDDTLLKGEEHVF